jgi:hypothetical protein
MSNDQERNFNVLSGRQNQICSFFLRGICSKGKACKFRHTQNVEVELTPLQQIINEIDIAVNRRNLSEIFQKMLLNKDNEYKKYYNEIHMKFRGYSVMKLKRQSIVDMFLGHEDKRNHTFDQTIFKYRNLKLDDTILPYGFIPFLFHFFIMGFAWNTFQGAKDIQEQSEIDECYIEFTAQLQKRYSNTEYDNIVKDACEFVDPDTKENMIMVASHYLCDRVVVDIKEVFKNIKRRKYTTEELSEERIEVGEVNFNKFINEDFTSFINDEYNSLNENAFDLFNKRKIEPQTAYQKYQEKRDKAISRSRSDPNIIADAIQRYEYNISQYEHKIKIFYNSIFNDNVTRKKIILAAVNWKNIFDSRLANLVGTKNKFGTRCNPDVLSELIRIIQTEITNKDQCPQMIITLIKMIPSDLMNAPQIIQIFKDKNLIDYLWNTLLDSISLENSKTFCPELLKEFLKESSKGLQEAYTSQYAEKISNLDQNQRI